MGAGAVQQVADPYANEPERHPALVVRTAKPFNAETPGALLAGSPLTPVDLFYVRNHLPVPHIDAATHSVRPPLHDPQVFVWEESASEKSVFGMVLRQMRP